MDESSIDRITTPEMLEAIMTTLSNARSEGEPYESQAEQHLGPIEAIILHIGRERRDIEASLKLENDELDLCDRQIDAAIHNYADEIWEQLGCPDYDPIFNILFPQSAAKVTAHREGAQRLFVLADMLEKGIHPRIDRTIGARIAQEIRTIGTRYQEHEYTHSKHQFRKSALDTLEASVARIGLLQLGTLRRTLRANGIDDTHIRSLVPAPVSSRRFPTR